MKTNKDINILPTIKSKNKEIKIKVVQRENSDKEINNFYNSIEGSEENISNVKTLKNPENKEDYTKESKTKSKLNSIIMDNIDIDEENVEIDESIKNLVINNENNNDYNINVNNQKHVESNLYKVQIAALKDKQQADIYVNRIKRFYKDLLVGLDVYILEIDLEEKGIFYRIRIGDFENKKLAEKFCENFFKKNDKVLRNCIVVK